MTNQYKEFKPLHSEPVFLEHRANIMTSLELQQQRQRVVQVAAELVVGKEGEVAFGD